MVRMIKWPSIEQYRNVVHNVTHSAHYIGKDENGDPIYDTSRNKPVLKFEGTCKLHGTNSSVCMNSLSEMWFQSRENIITPEKDNAGFAMFATANKPTFFQIGNAALDQVDSSLTVGKTIVIFGEWAGKGIQKGVAISELPKMFVIFGIAFADAEGNKTYLTRKQMELAVKDVLSNHNSIFCIYEFQTYEITIDFNNPHYSQNMLTEITEIVEAECPVGKAFGVSGVGEGVVWRCISEGYEDSGFWFKVKGERHAAKGSKVKTLAAVDVERIDNIKELAVQLTPTWRLEQMLQQTFNTLNGGQVDIKGTGPYIKNVMADILKECLPEITASGFTTRDITGPISKIARDYLLTQLEM